ncbi:hypothetical protein [Methylobacterium sp. NFXW15]|uniref:hypothetical protein n=1 Tax=Methylobacterium sp. NFXW15 TaxID=2819512 RepID=UPI003CF57B24
MTAARSSLLPVIGAGLILGFLGAAAPAVAAQSPTEALTLALPGPLPPVRVLTLLVGLHLVGLCFGLGGATMLDFWILRWMRWGGLPPEIARIFLFVSKVCSVGLILLWISGLGFLAVYAVESPEKFQNPKLWAKITVVGVLTLNGLIIHSAVLPGVLRDVGRPMLDGISGARTGIFLVSGAVSGVSWYTAFALGLMRELNGTVAYSTLIGLWLLGVATASFGAYTLWLHLREWSAFRRGKAEGAAALDAEPRIPPSQFVRIRAAASA